MVAHHYVNALELARAAGQDVSAITGRARAALGEAGDRALALNALPQAEKYFRDALALADASDADRPDLLFRLGRALYLRYEEGEEELAEARDALLARGDREAAAEAVLMLADIRWKRGRSEETTAYLEDARALVADAPPSRIRVRVLSEVSRYQMLADDNEAAIETGTEALRLAQELGFDDLRAHALNNIGSARSALGDIAGLAEIEESIAIAAQTNAISDFLRGHNNLSTMQFVYAELEQAHARAQETLRLAEHFGHYGQVRFLEGGAAVGIPYTMGQWDEALENADRYLAFVEQGSPQYQTPVTYCHRALIRLGRADSDGAASDAERALDVVGSFRDPQVVQPTLAMTSHLFLSVGQERRAAGIVADAIERLRSLPQLAYAAVELHYLTWVALAFGRAPEVAEFAARDPLDSAWLRAVSAIAAGDLGGAAGIYEEIGARTAAAFYHLQAAKQRLAHSHLDSALDFYRSVGASRYVREGEALLAASA
jgi:tetratricopeptide (TPR) repeat protein